MRLWHLFGWLSYLTAHILHGSWQVVVSAFNPDRVVKPAIIEFPLQCETDLEISMLASSITITPGTLVLGVAAAEGETPPTLFVHSLFDNDPERVLEGLQEMESKVLAALRKGWSR